MISLVPGIIDSMPDNYRVTHFSTQERLVRQPEYEIANGPAFARHLKRCIGTCLLRTGLKVHIDRIPLKKLVNIMALSREVDSGASLAKEWLPALADNSLVYAHAGLAEERESRNLFRVRYGKHGAREAASMLGQDIDRYVPGLYWLNYFSRAYLTEHPVDLIAVGGRFGREIERTQNGYLLQLYDDPACWCAHDPAVRSILDEARLFFSMSRVGSMPDGLSPGEFSRTFLRLASDWP